MIGKEFTTTDDYTDDSTVGPYGYPVQIILSTEKPTFLQFARPGAGFGRSRVTWELDDVPFPSGDFRFGKVYGIRAKTNGDASRVFGITVFKEDPIVQGFSSSSPFS